MSIPLRERVAGDENGRGVDVLQPEGTRGEESGDGRSDDADHLPQVPVDGWEIVVTDNVFIKQMVLNGPGWVVPQHRHRYDHATLLTLARVRVWRDGTLWGDFIAPHVLEI